MRAGVRLEDGQYVGRALWLAQRRRGVGGSDAAAILGLSPWASPFSVWLEKSGMAKEKPQTEPMWWGLALEDVIARRYSEATGRKVWKPEALLQHPEHDCLIATPDFLVIDEDRGLEVKTANAWASEGWGPEGTDQIPRHYLVQCLHYMAVTGFSVWDVAVLIGGSDFRIYTVRRDTLFERMLVSRLVEWWQKHIVNGEQPALDGSDGASAYLKDRYAVDTAPRIPADEEAESLGQQLLSVKRQLRDAEAQENRLTNQLKALIGDAEGMDGKCWLVTWKAAKAKEAVNWEQLAVALMERLQGIGQGDAVNDALAKASYQKPGVRAFRLIEKKS